jgi:predicted nucleic acid-binding Zn ribbon protein
MEYCVNCGTSTSGRQSFCGRCGRQLRRARWYRRVNKRIAVAGGIVLLVGAVRALSDNQLAPIKPMVQSAAQEAVRTEQCHEIKLLNQFRKGADADIVAVINRHMATRRELMARFNLTRAQYDALSLDARC